MKLISEVHGTRIDYYGISLKVKNSGFIATNRDGQVMYFQTKPHFDSDFWFYLEGRPEGPLAFRPSFYGEHLFTVDLEGKDWTSTLYSIDNPGLELSKNYRLKVKYYGMDLEVQPGYLAIDQNGLVCWFQFPPSKNISGNSWALAGIGLYEGLGVVGNLKGLNWENTLCLVESLIHES